MSGGTSRAMKKTYFTILALLSAVGVSYAQIVQSSAATAQSIGTAQVQMLTATSGTYTTPTGATYVEVCLYGAGGGGGAATSGGAAAHGGGSGQAGALMCGTMTSPAASYAYLNGVGGTAGTCSASPSAAGNATGNTSFGTGAVHPIVNQGNGGGTASTVADGTAGSGGSASGGGASYAPTEGGNWSMTINLAGGGAAAGSGATIRTGCGIGGACGGTNATVNASGACVNPSTAGQNGFIIVKAYFN